MGITTVEFGRKGEDLAVSALQSKGYKILARNYRHRRFEIDIVAKHHKTIVFIEVKNRKHGSLDAGFELKKNQMKRIISASQNYLFNQNCGFVETRFDLIVIYASGASIKTEHIIEAFSPSELIL